MFYGWTSIIVGSLGGCGVSLPEPVIVAVAPEVVYNGVDTRISIEGANFYPRLEIAGDADYTAGYEVEILGPDLQDEVFRLAGVSLASYERLGASVEQAMAVPPGLYDVRVIAPTGATAMLEDALTVTDFQAARLDVVADQLTYEVVQDTAGVEVLLVDYDGNRVFAPLDISVVVEDVTDPTAVVDVDFVPNSLENQQLGVPPNRILGRLDADGARLIGFTVNTPRVVRVRAVPQNSRSGVAEGSVSLQWEPGSDLSVDIKLPDTDFTTQAGVPFTATLQLFDEYGNQVDDVNQTLFLIDDCTNYAEVVDVAGPTDITVTLKKATGVAGCPTDRIRSVATGITGVSEPVRVLAGPTTLFDVQVGIPVGGIVAGEKFDLSVFPFDAYFNPTPWDPVVSLEDSVGGLQAGASCAPGSPLKCSVVLQVAGEDITITASSDDGVNTPVGTSSPFEVAAGPPGLLDVTVPGGAPVAGEPFALHVLVTDLYENPVSGTALEGDDFAFADANDEVSCTFTARGSGGELEFSCGLTTAVATQIEVTLLDPGVVGLSPPLNVLNGPLARLEVAPRAVSIEAGELLEIDVAGFDAYGNALSDGDKQLDLTDTAGSMQPLQITLDQNGQLSAVVRFELAGVTQIVGSQGGLALPDPSEPVQVVASTPDRLEVSVDAPWAWLGEPTSVRVEALDRFGNRADFSGSAAVDSQTGSAPSQLIPVTNGLGTRAVTWSQATTQERLVASAGSLAGSSHLFPVVEDCLGDGPSALLSFVAGLGTACWDEGSQSASLLVDMSGSVGGTSSAKDFAVARGDRLLALSVNNPTFEVQMDSMGEHPLVGLAIQANGCADTDGGTAWVGPDDGEPVGPLVLGLASPTLTTGVQQTPLTVSGVTTCTGDPADGGTVWLRTSRGSLTGVSSTGTGLATVLDPVGKATLSLDAATAHTGGPTHVVAWVPTGAARGQVSATFLGDNRSPRVWAQDPVGDTPHQVDSIRLTFSEPLLPGSVVLDHFDVMGPGAVLDEVGLDSDRVVVLTLLDPVEGGGATFDVLATTDLRDQAGNKLDGDYTGVLADYAGMFGDLPGGVDPVDACAADLERFRPDGDPGEGVESDAVGILIESASAPVWWSISIDDPTGARVASHRLPAVLAAEPWAWDGRDQAGAVVGNGAYAITVDALDGAGNAGGACTAVVTVDNVVEIDP